jgi:hypothetical protein
VAAPVSREAKTAKTTFLIRKGMVTPKRRGSRVGNQQLPPQEISYVYDLVADVFDWGVLRLRTPFSVLIDF